MNDGLKQRVIGAFVLLALAIIFLPMLFDFSGERYIDRTPQIPELPDITPKQFEQPVRPEKARFPKLAEQAFQPDDSQLGTSADGSNNDSTQDPVEQAVVESAPAPGLNSQGVLAAWVIQVGAFSEQIRAEKLDKALRADGYLSYWRENPARGLFFVYIGPDADQQTLLDIQKQVDKKYQLTSKILSFDP